MQKVKLIFLGISILAASPVYSQVTDNPIKLGYCAYGGWGSGASQWYSNYANLIITSESRKDDIRLIKGSNVSAVALMYKIALNKNDSKHGAYGYDWVNKNHGGYIEKAIKNKENLGKGGLYVNSGEVANFLDTKNTRERRRIIVEISTPGSLSEAKFRWSQDGGKDWSDETIVRSDVYGLIDGIKVFFKGKNFQKGDQWIFNVQDCWFLLDKSGNRMTDLYSEDSRKNVFWMDWGNPNWQKYWVDDVIGDLEMGYWDGVFADCNFVGIQKYWAPNGVLQYTSDDEFNEAIESFNKYAYERINAIGKLFVPNLADAVGEWVQRIEYTHGGVDEGFVNITRWSKNIWRSAEQWEQQVSNLEETCAREKVYFAMAHNRGLNEQDLLFNLASFLLGQDGKNAFFYNAGIPGYEFENYMEDYKQFQHIYDVNIGNPDGKRYQKDGLWFREYKNGLVLANPTSSLKQLTLGKEYIDPSGSVISGTIQVSGHEGIILLNRKPK